MNPINIKDKFLCTSDFINLHDAMLASDFEWYYSSNITNSSNNSFQFCHSFYKDGIPGPRFDLLIPLLQKIQPFALFSIKANLITRTSSLDVHDFHVDINRPDITTAVFYINSCDGFTLFRNGTKVESVANRFVSFPCQTEHTGTSCTNSKVRILINLNYFK